MKKISYARTPPGRTRFAAVLRTGKGSIVTVDDAARALEMPRVEVAKQLARWSEQGRLKRLRRGVYLHVPEHAADSDIVLPNAWAAVPVLFGPAYIGGWTAASHWGLTEQITRTVFVFSQRRPRHRDVEVAGVPFRLRHIHERTFFGLRASWHEAVRVDVSDPAKTIIDMLNAPETGGGIAHVAHCLRGFLSHHHPDVEKLVAYTDRLGNGAVFKRLGLLAEILDREDLVAESSKRMTAGISELDPPHRGSKTVTRWRLHVPENWQRVLADD